jgi:outer membrane autotransporter protein
VRTPLRHALLVTTALCSASAFGLIPLDRALAQSVGGSGGSGGFGGGAGGGYEQNGGNGQAGNNGGGGGGPGAAGTLGGLPGNNDSGGGGAGGVNGATAAAMPVGSFNGGNGGNATPAVNAVTIAGGGGGAGGYGVVLTTAGPHTTTAGQVFTGGTGGAANGLNLPGNGGSGGGGLLLLVGGTFTNVFGASLVGGVGGATPSVSGCFLCNFGGNGLTTSNYVGATSAATVINAGAITGGAGGVLIATPGAPAGSTFNFSGIGGVGANFFGGSFTNADTGVITGGIGGAGFGGTATLGAGSSGFGGLGLGASGGGVVTNNGQIIGGAGPGGTVQAGGSRPANEFANGQNTFAGGSGGTGAANGGTASAPGQIVNNATGIIRGGRGGDGTNGVVNATSPHAAAGAGGAGGLGVSITSGSILNFGQILGGAAGTGANATVAGQVGGSDPFNGGGTAVELRGIFNQSVTMSLDNRATGIITGGTGSTPGTSGAGAAGAKGGDGGLGVDARKPVTGTLTILNSGQISGGNGAAGSAGTPNGANGLGGVGIQMLFDGTITTSGGISGGLNGDGVTRANAITFLSGVHTLTLQTGATFAGNVVVDTAAASNPGVAASNTLNLDGAGTGNVSLPQFHNFGHLTQTSGSGGTWTLTGAGAVTLDTTVSAGTMVLGAGAVLTSPNVNLLTGGTLSLSTAALANDALNINGGTLQVTGTTLNSLPNTIAYGASGGTFDIVAAANTFSINQALTGAGSLTKIGAGTLALTGDNTYSGGTTISAGTLQLGNGGTTGSVAGNILNNAILAFNRSNALTFGGVISGTGAVHQDGAGTTVLTANNTYTGGTTINAGTLQLGNGGTSGSIVGNVLNNGTLAFNRSDAVTFGGVISGTGALQQNGGGSTNLTATNTYTGATTVNAGTLLVNGSIATSSCLTVNAGGAVGGSGALPKTTINGGTLSPGNSIGTISIGGSLSFVGAGNYIVEVAPATADRTNVTGAPGTAALAGTLVAVGTGGSYTIGTRYTVLNATGGISGTFGNLAISGNFGATRPHIEYDANNVYLVLDQGLITPFLVGGTPNQRSVAGAIDTALTAGSQAAPFLALFGLTAAQLPGALDQLSGEVHVSTAGVLADESRYMREAVLGRLRQASYGSNASMASLSVGGPMAAFADGELDSALAYGKSPIVTKAQMRAPQAQADVVFWAQGFGARGRFETDGNAATVRRDLAGFISGIDTPVGGNGRLGVAAGYTGSKNALDGRGTADVETAHIAGYGGWNFGAFNLRAGGAYAFHSIATDRLIAFPGFFDRTTANYDGHTGQVFGELGYGFAFGNVAIEPFAGAAWVRVKTDAAAERGGLAALNVAGTTFETGYATLGIRAASLIPLGYDMVLVPRGTLAWQHAFDSVTPAGALAFQAAPVPFTIAGVPIARDSLLAEAGLDLAIGRHATLGVSYVGQIASNVQDHAAKGKFSWKF